MRAAAQVEPVAGAVHGDRLVGGQLHHPFGLERLALLLEEAREPRRAIQTSRTSGSSAAMIRRISSSIAGRSSSVNGPRSGGRREIVIEAVVGRRAEGDLRAGKQVLHRLGEDVGIIVPDQLERVGLVARGDQRELGIALERPGEVAHLAVDPRRQRRLGEARPDRRRDVGRRGPALDLADRSVGQLDREHVGHCGRGSLANVRVAIDRHRVGVKKTARHAVKVA